MTNIESQAADAQRVYRLRRRASQRNNLNHMDNVTIKVTRRMHSDAVNSMECNYYRYVTGRIYNGDKTQYRPFRFVVIADSDDVWEYTDNQDYTREDIFRCLDEFEFATLDLIRGFKDSDTNDFYDVCKESLNRHYRSFKHEYDWDKAIKWMDSLL